MNEYLESLRHLKESEDHIEFKEAKRNFNFNGGSHKDPRERRHCILGYVVALANEGGGRLVFGMADHKPHQIVGTTYEQGNLGALEDAIYESMATRVRIEEEFDADKRVIIFNVPSRPIGKTLKFEGVALMRTGESLREMSDEEIFRILSEQEPDFSAKACLGLSFDDLEPEALRTMKVKYAEKQKNPSFRNLPDQQVLSDLELFTPDGHLTFAALILLGRSEKIHHYLPQSNIVVEYRKNKASIPYTIRKEFQQPLFLAIDQVWNFLNQPLTNPDTHFQDGPYIFDISAFNEITVREAILNAVAHRSMRIQSDVVIKQSPDELTILNPGGLPIGVTLDNILTISSTPRSKRLTEVMQKTGLVERSGQGVDKMFANTILDGKLLPTYQGTDLYQVQLTLKAQLLYPELMRFLRIEQNKRGEDNQLNVFQLLALYNVYIGNTTDVPSEILSWLQREKLIRQYRGQYKLATNSKINNVGKQLTERQKLIRSKMMFNDTLTTSQLAETLSLSTRTIQRDLNVLEAQGIIKHSGGRKERIWQLVK